MVMITSYCPQLRFRVHNYRYVVRIVHDFVQRSRGQYDVIMIITTELWTLQRSRGQYDVIITITTELWILQRSRGQYDVK
jgi:hypothetical protein